MWFRSLQNLGAAEAAPRSLQESLRAGRERVRGSSATAQRDAPVGAGIHRRTRSSDAALYFEILLADQEVKRACVRLVIRVVDRTRGASCVHRGLARSGLAAVGQTA